MPDDGGQDRGIPAPHRGYLSPRATAELIDSSVSTLAKWRLRGEGPPYRKIGRKILYCNEEVIAWIDSFRRTNTSQNSLPNYQTREKSRDE